MTLSQIKTSLLIIEDWLDQRYPVLARMYYTEFIKKELLPLEINLSENAKRIPLQNVQVNHTAHVLRLVGQNDRQSVYSPFLHITEIGKEEASQSMLTGS